MPRIGPPIRWLGRLRCWFGPHWFGWCALTCLACQSGATTAIGEAPPFALEIASVRVCESSARADSTAEKGAPALLATSTLGVKVRLTGNYAARVPANYFYGSLLSRDGTRYLPATDGCRPLLSGPPLLPGETREGYLNFPIVAKKSAHRLSYAPNLQHTHGVDALDPRSRTVEVPLP